MISLKNELIGSWQLLSYIEISVNGADSFFPLGNTPTGVLIYSADGYMSVQVMGSNIVQETPESLLQDGMMLKNHLAFSGSYFVDNRNAVVSHHVTTSLNPNLIGRYVDRSVMFEGDVLFLKSTRPVFSNGESVNSHMTWQRLEKFESNIRKEQSLQQLSHQKMKLS